MVRSPLNQILAIAVGGAAGALLRHLVSSGVYGWLGHDFPYGTLAVNLLGSFLIGLMTEALVVEQVTVAVPFRAGVLVGVFGSFTTFSTFSLETLYLFQQGRLPAALANAGISAAFGLAAVFMGLLCGRALFYYGRGVAYWHGVMVPYALLVTNFLGAALVGFLLALLLEWNLSSPLLRAVLTLGVLGVFVTFSTLYLALFFFEERVDPKSHGHFLLAVFLVNAAVCVLGIWLGIYGGERL